MQRRVNALVEADGRLHDGLQGGVVHDVVVVEGLLDQQQAKVVKVLQGRSVVRNIGGVGVHLQGQIRPAVPYRLHGLDIPTRLDLELYPGIPVVDPGRHAIQQLGDRRLDALGHSDRHPIPPAAQGRLQRMSGPLRLEIPDRILQRGLGHGMTAHGGKQPFAIARGHRPGLQQPRRQVAGHHVQGGAHRFGRIPRSGSGHALPPAGQIPAAHRRQNGFAVRLAPKTGLEGVHVGKPDVVQFDARNADRLAVTHLESPKALGSRSDHAASTTRPGPNPPAGARVRARGTPSTAHRTGDGSGSRRADCAGREGRPG